MMLHRNFGYENDALIQRAVNYAEKLIFEYYQVAGRGSSPAIMALIEKKREKITDELDEAFEFFTDKKNIGDIDVDTFKFVYDRVMSAIKVYGVELREEPTRPNVIDEIDEELKNIDKLLKFPSKILNYDLYTIMRLELKTGSVKLVV